jgi:hypothetical protein
MRRRWDVDERGHGVADGRALIGELDRLRAAFDEDDWVTEQPDIHLLPHVRRYCESDGSPLQLIGAEITDGVLEVRLRRVAREGGSRSTTEAVYALLGTIAEPATFVHVIRADETTFEIGTGVLEGDSEFAPHGHTLRLSIET